MQELYRSDLLRSLGWAITDSLWQMSLLWLVYQVLVVIPFRKKPAIKHIGAFAALVVGTAWFLFSFVNRFSHERSSVEPVSDTAPVISISLTNILNSTLPYFSTAYLLILVLLLARLIYHFLATQKLKVDLKPALDWQHVVNRLTVSLGISREVFIYISENISVPSTIGYLKPIILLPLASVNQLSVEQLEAVIIHEMAHIRRNDYLVNLMVAFIETVLFFNPFAHLLGRAIRKECELCCDDEVIRQQDPQAYAQALLLLERSKLKPAMALAVTGKQGMLLGRVKRILNLPDQEVKYRHKLLALVCLAGLIMLTALLAPTKISEQDRQKTNVAASTASPQKSEHVPLPFVMRIPPAPEVPAKQRSVTREKKQVIIRPQAEKHVENIKDLEFVNIVDAPTPPVHPNAPEPPAFPVEEFVKFYNVPAPADQKDDMVFSFNAPDPRDRRSPDILRRSKAGTAVQRIVRPKAPAQMIDGFAIPDVEKLEESIAMAGKHAELFVRDVEANEMMRRVFTTSPAKVKRIEEERRISTPRAAQKKTVTTIPAENGMTITIIQSNEQIEITVNDKR